MSKSRDRFNRVFNRRAKSHNDKEKSSPSFLKSILNPQTAIEDGWRYEHGRPKLSEIKKKELMDASSLETPRSTTRAVMGILAPYWTKSSLTERAIAATLLSRDALSILSNVSAGEWW